MRLALYQPDIPQNAGAMLRLAACLGIGVDIIGPCGFLLDDRRLRRVGMDYLARVHITRHDSWSAFLGSGGNSGGNDGATGGGRRLVLLTTRATQPYFRLKFTAADTILVGRESAGVPDEVHAAVAATVRVPMAPGLRSLNVALAAAMVLGEAMRQTGDFAPDEPAGVAGGDLS